MPGRGNEARAMRRMAVDVAVRPSRRRWPARGDAARRGSSFTCRDRARRGGDRPASRDRVCRGRWERAPAGARRPYAGPRPRVRDRGGPQDRRMGRSRGRKQGVELPGAVGRRDAGGAGRLLGPWGTVRRRVLCARDHDRYEAQVQHRPCRKCHGQRRHSDGRRGDERAPPPRPRSDLLFRTRVTSVGRPRGRAARFPGDNRLGGGACRLRRLAARRLWPSFALRGRSTQVLRDAPCSGENEDRAEPEQRPPHAALIPGVHACRPRTSVAGRIRSAQSMPPPT